MFFFCIKQIYLGSIGLHHVSFDSALFLFEIDSLHCYTLHNPVS